MIAMLAALALSLAAGCGSGKKDDPGIGADSDSDTDSETDSGTGTGTGTGSETDDGCEYDCEKYWDEACCPLPYGEDYGYPDCTDLTSDDYNCGGCGIVCDEGADLWCVDSECVCVWDECAGTCVNFDDDPDHCGDCDTVCPASDRACLDGACAPCEAAGLALCGADCEDLRVDDRHCGDCDTRCRGESVCAAGVCVEGTCDEACRDSICCASPWGGAAPGCTDPRMDRANCGACGAVCAAPAFCDGGVCTCASPFGGGGGADPIRECGGTCVDTRTSAAHCGACDTACAAGETCADGVCGVTLRGSK
jgi:hypothetical protein